MSIDEYIKIDSTFNESLFMTKANNIFIKLFTSIMLDKLEEIKHFVSDDVYNYALNILNNAKSKGHRQMYDELNILSSKIVDIQVNENVYEIKVFLQSRFLNYIISLSDGSYISGNNSFRENFDYNLTFTKKLDAKDEKIVRRCPTCGYPLDTNNSGKCEYCGSIYNQEDYDWVLTKLEVLN